MKGDHYDGNLFILFCSYKMLCLSHKALYEKSYLLEFTQSSNFDLYLS